MRRTLFWIGLLLAVVILLANLQAWLLLNRTRTTLEAELGDRLQAIAVTFAATVGANWQSAGVTNLLKSLLDQNELFNAFIVSEDLRYVANARDPNLVDSTDATLELDAAEIIAAFAGLPAQSQLYSAGRARLKTAYAPLTDSLGAVAAVVGIEADARFFGTLTSFQQTVLIINLFSLLAIVAVVLVAAGLTRRAIALEQAAGRANALALLGQLSAAVAHDLRNPLAIIRTTAERLKRRYAQGPDPQFDYIPEEVDRLNTIISNYLTLGSARASTPEPVDLPALLGELAADLSSELSHHAIRLTTSLAPAPPVNAGRVELRQAFLNILLNAIQAQPDGGAIDIATRIETSGRRRWLVATVHDHGPGIPPEHRRRVFEPFFTTKEKGSGLGLFSVRRIITGLGGQVAIDSQPGAGTTVTVRLPL